MEALSTTLNSLLMLVSVYSGISAARVAVPRTAESLSKRSRKKQLAGEDRVDDAPGAGDMEQL